MTRVVIIIIIIVVVVIITTTTTTTGMTALCEGWPSSELFAILPYYRSI
jgi:hypothetical protein